MFSFGFSWRHLSPSSPVPGLQTGAVVEDAIDPEWVIKKSCATLDETL